MTLEEATKEIDHLTIVADDARQAAIGLQFIVGNLLLDLHRQKVINAVSFLERIRQDVPDLENAMTRSAVEATTALFLLEFEQKRTPHSN